MSQTSLNRAANRAADSAADQAADAAAWCRRYRQAQDPTARVVFFPHAGGSAPFFRPFAQAIGPAVDVVAVQYPGRQDRMREEPIRNLHVLADRCAEMLGADERRELPLTLFGHSMGASLAFEVAQRLEAAGRGPLHLFVSGRGAPAGQRVERVHLRDDAGIVAEIRAGGGTAPVILDNPQLLQFALPALRADYQAIETYRCVPGASVRCPITALTGERDGQALAPDVAAWAQHTTGPFAVRTFDGGHFYLVDHVSDICAVLEGSIAAQLAQGRPGMLKPDVVGSR
jgi:surfactin synthase thioesterase subunit